jgi:hypothetical protein
VLRYSVLRRSESGLPLSVRQNCQPFVLWPVMLPAALEGDLNEPPPSTRIVPSVVTSALCRVPRWVAVSRCPASKRPAEIKSRSDSWATWRSYELAGPP